jgi:putative zinc finger protein
VTAPVHPAADQISDLVADVLPASEAMSVNAHLAACVECRQVRDDLLDVIALLGDQGSVEVAMPDEVARSLDAALRRAADERAAGVMVLDPVRRAAGRQRWRWLAGAAAVAAIVAVGVPGLRSLEAPGGNADDAGSSADSLRGAVQNGADRPLAPAPSPATGFGLTGGQVASLRPDQVPAAARHLVSTAPARHQAALPRETGGCAAPIAGRLSAVIRFEGARAVLSVDRATRTATVYDCATATRALLVTGF